MTRVRVRFEPFMVRFIVILIFVMWLPGEGLAAPNKNKKGPPPQPFGRAKWLTNGAREGGLFVCV